MNTITIDIPELLKQAVKRSENNLHIYKERDIDLSCYYYDDTNNIPLRRMLCDIIKILIYKQEYTHEQ